ncbi:MAG: 50S ribosomal protein L22 [Verrucomicrobiae bacterium]|nr:50S ribosomal protein L22 [Verrucomicrobiae bacterium]
MEVQAVTKYVRISPSKANDVARVIRGMSASAALDTLQFVPRKAAKIIRKTLQSAIANAENNAQLDVNDLVVKTAMVGAGPQIKRWIAVARGSAHPIIKRTSHITVILSDEGGTKKAKTQPKAKAASKSSPKGTSKTEETPESAKAEEKKA